VSTRDGDLHSLEPTAGNVRLADKGDRREFSGTLQMLSVFERLVPTEGQRQQVKGV
jgi:hypothetical protein